MKVTEVTKRELRLRRNCPHYFVPTKAMASPFEKGDNSMPVEVFMLLEPVCCVCYATPEQVRKRLENTKIKKEK